MRDKFNRRLPALTHRNAPATIFKPAIDRQLEVTLASMKQNRNVQPNWNCRDWLMIMGWCYDGIRNQNQLAVPYCNGWDGIAYLLGSGCRGSRDMSDLIILGNIACERPTTRLGMKRLTLLAKRENVRRTPSLWAMLPNYDKALDALGKRI